MNQWLPRDLCYMIQEQQALSIWCTKIHQLNKMYASRYYLGDDNMLMKHTAIGASWCLYRNTKTHRFYNFVHTLDGGSDVARLPKNYFFSLVSNTNVVKSL